MKQPIETREPEFLDDEQPEFGPPEGMLGEINEADTALADEAADRQKMADEATLDALGNVLDRKFREDERKRFYIEDRWLEDLRQYHGRYDAETERALLKGDSCALFLNVTKPKTHAYSARVMDMVLPTDDKNWGLSPTPVPEIAGMGAGPPEAPVMTTAPDGTQTPVQTPEGAPVQERDVVKGVKDEAAARCSAMEEEIDDQLVEAKYNTVQRLAIEQMAKLGTGVIMGPVILDEFLMKWEAVPRPPKEGQPPPPKPEFDYVMKRVPNDEKRAGVQWVDCWNFYPDMTSSRSEGWEHATVQYLCNESEFRKYAKRFEFMPEPTERVLKGGTPFNINALRWIQELRELSETNNSVDTRIRLLCYYGEITKEDLEAAGHDADKMGITDTLMARVWFVDRTVLKIDLNPLDSGELPFSVCYCDKDELSPFGTGIPRLMRGEQESVNAAWRMKHDNAGLSVGPQTIMKLNGVMPADGDYKLSPKKMWYAGDEVDDVRKNLGTFNIDSHQPELSDILQLALRFADDVTQLPLLMQGDQAPHITQTAQGMSLLYNASTVVLRRTVKFYDDCMTEPLIGRFYQWNMQFNPRGDIKGDFRAVARGSSTLLDKEQQGQALDAAMQLAMQPVWQPFFDMKKLAREAMKGKRIGDVMNDDETIDKALKDQAEAQKAAAEAEAKGGAAAPAAAPPPDPMAQAKIDIEREKIQAKREETASRERVAIAQIASSEKISFDAASAKFASIKLTTDHDAKKFNSEMDMKAKVGTGI